MAKNMTDEQINKIAQTIAAKLAEPGGPGLLGCGSASSSQNYFCSGTSGYSCSSYYECGGAARFGCDYFSCQNDFRCAGDRVDCIFSFSCSGQYTSN